MGPALIIAGADRRSAIGGVFDRAAY